ncbi:ARM repeat-containing protein [Sodiomyces alkalinus F11]|uniref:ARM repeat-containing protein n=1 Tax=Sodiomyces alkalinus (strain CBS 110278 / VKM F-3762 / F11) TaxID=1314773 RepID=A0A3N2PLZ2_SODAK|nr:ARM repeat-containing protein [Sodiomyces alkalinus F11]ROT35547.1 ARM repeat-containing protein [Sodiomyces alkalinus F11]
MTWQPAPESLSQLAVCLKDSLSGFDKEARKQAETMLAQAKSSPDINNYLAYLFSSSGVPAGVPCRPEEYHLVRSAAAVMLKNNIRSNYKELPDNSLALIKLAVPMGIQDTHPQIRSYAGNIATEIIRRGGLLSWPELLPQLLSLLSNESGQVSNEAQEGAMAAMAKICEDNAKVLDREVNGERPLNVLLPKLIEAAKNPLPKVRAQALTAVNIFIPRKSQAMLNNIDLLLSHLFVLASDSHPDVRRQVCHAFVQLVEARSDKLKPHIGGLVDYIVTQQQSDDEDLACEAAEFWLAVGEHDDLWKSLSPYLDKIIPVLLESMVYGGEDIALLGGASDDEDEEDREEDIRPAFAKKQAARSAANGPEGPADSAQNGNAYEKLGDMDEDFEEGEIDDDLDDGDENPNERWTVRKCSAAALDVFSRDFQDSVFTAILPYLTTNLKHEDWPRREAAVLALGAVAEGAINAVTPHLPELIPYLLTLLEDTEPIVRQITCWTLGRYSSWAATLDGPNAKTRYFEPLMDGILRKMLDKNKKVQEAAASAFANLEDQAGKVLEPYVGPILQQFVLCFQRYKDRNMYILYDCVQTLAEQIGPLLARPDFVNTLMPALIDRYQKVTDQSRELFPLLECLSYVAMALNDTFSPYAQPIFSRCVNIIHVNLELALQATNRAGLESPDKDFLVTSLDLLSAILQAIEERKAQELVSGSGNSFFDLLGFCLEDPQDDVRQSAYALLGDCARYVFPQLEAQLPNIFPILLKQLDFDSILDEEMDSGFSVVNNACWSAGEIAMQNTKAMGPFVPELLQRLVDIISNPGVVHAVTENAAIALGRLGLHNHEQLAPLLNTFAEDFLNVMEGVESSEEKATAFKGFTMVVGQNPRAIERALPQFFVAIARYRDLNLQNPIKQELHDVFQNVLNLYRQLIPSFDDFIGQMQPADREVLRTHYAL